MRLALVITVLFVTACKGDAQKCDTACRNFGTLVYWQNADKQIAAAPESQRESLRKKLLGMFDSQLENGIDGCVSQCQSANNEKQIDCMITAKTADQASACAK